MIGGPLKKKRNVTRRPKKSHCRMTRCRIMSPRVSNFSLSRRDKRGSDFYSWVNETWVSDRVIPPYESEFGVSDEVEQCVMATCLHIVSECVKGKFKGPGPEAIATLHNSYYKLDEEKHRNLDLLRCMLQPVSEMKTKEDLVRQFAKLTKYRFPSVIQLDVSSVYDTKRRQILSINPDFPSLEDGFFSDAKTMDAYENLLRDLGHAMDIDGMEKVAGFEKTLSKRLINHIDINAPVSVGNGHTLLRKFGKIPWNTYFQELGIEDWRKKKFEYNYPGFLRKLGTLFEEIPIEKWKLYIYKIYLTSVAEYSPLSSIYFKFKGAFLGGQKEKEPKRNTFIDFLYSSLPDTLSPLYWDVCGDMEVLEDCKGICQDIRLSARNRLKETEWLKPSTRLAAIEKVNKMDFLIGRPDTWYEDTLPALEPIFLRNVLLLGEYATNKMIKRVSANRHFWEQGIYRVNAYYYEACNQIIIPYAIISDPYYKKGGGRAWNYGSIGFTVGHEVCHGFDDEGKEYDSHGRKKSWWTPADNRAYNKKTNDIIKLYEKKRILGKKVDGINTLGENIADIAGLGIALEALKRDMKRRGVKEINDIQEEYREFFISYAVGWRILYRDRKLRTRLETDVHSPAQMRVNLVVAQFNEWYSAFDIQKGDELYIEEKDRIHFF